MKKFTLILNCILICSFCSAQTISAGVVFSVAVCSDNTVRAWGYNYNGQLGNGTFISDSVPVQVNGLTGVIKIASGSGHTLALKSDGTVWAWGSNYNGQIGDNTTFDRSIPVQVNGLSNMVAVGCGHQHSFAVRNDGTLWSWGDNTNGQLGDSTHTDRHIPVQVHGLSGIVAATGGAFHSLALKIDGTVWAWGDCTSGQAGDNDSNAYEHVIPVQVLISNATAIACHDYSCIALKNDSTVWGWGDGWAGQLGDSAYNNSSSYILVPFPVIGISGVAAISVTNENTLALKGDNTIWGWGNGAWGELGNGNTNGPFTFPVQMTGITNAVAVAGAKNSYHSMVLKSDGTLWGCGTNADGELGNGTTSGNNPNPLPGQVISLCSVLIPPVNCSSNYILSPDTSQPHTYFLVSNSTGTPPIRHLWSWGDGFYDTIPFPTHTYADTGYYTICHSVFDAAGCSSVFCNTSNLMIVPPQMVTVNVVSSIPSVVEENKNIIPVTLFPNPASTELTIQNAELKIKEIEIYNMVGEKIFSKQPEINNQQHVTISLFDFLPGIYFITVTDEAGNKVTKKVVKM